MSEFDLFFLMSTFYDHLENGNYHFHLISFSKLKIENILRE